MFYTFLARFPLSTLIGTARPFMETYFLCCLILLTSFVEVHPETKVVYRGETVLLFANVTADSPDNKVHLYINGAKNYTRIASWKFEEAAFKLVSKTYQNIDMDVDRNIKIYNVDEKFIGKYFLHNSSRPAMGLIIIETKVVYRGETVLLFANVTADSPDNKVHLYINGVKNYTRIASWKFEEAGFKLVSRTYQNIDMDVDRNIKIYNVDEKFIGKYFLHNSSRPAIGLIIIEKKIVQRGEAVLLFANVTSDSTYNDVNLYIIGAKNITLIATWTVEKGQYTPFSETYQNIGIDAGRNIRIFNVTEHYAGKYSLLNSKRLSIELDVLGNSQTKLKTPSHHTALWIVSVALAIVTYH